MLLEEALRFLRLGPGDVILDATVGPGGHSQAIAARIMPGGLLIGLDRDPDAVEAARSRLSGFGDRVRIHQANYRDFPDVLKEEGVAVLDGMLLDLGISSIQLGDPSRGFSFQEEGPLDMRMDRRGRPTAGEVVHRASQGDRVRWIRDLGGDRYAARIARRIVVARSRSPIKTTLELARVVHGAYPPRRWRIHPATRTFQALRMVVNREQESLEEALPQVPRFLRAGARAVVISFHSGEDRIVKEAFRRASDEDWLRILTRKPLRATEQEVSLNRWARSALLRAAEKIT